MRSGENLCVNTCLIPRSIYCFISLFFRMRHLIKFQYGEEGLLRDFDRTDLLHTLLAFFLFLKQLTLTRNIAAVALGCNVLAYGFNGLARNDFCSYGCLDGNVELLAGYKFLELFAHTTTEGHGVVCVREGG